MDVCVPCGNAPPKWRDVIVDGKKKRKCEWVDEDGCECPASIAGGPSKFEGHWRIHTGEKPYKCTECGKLYSDSSALRSHERIHTGEKPYKCTLCDYKASQSSQITAHMRFHTGERTFVCTYPGCTMAFTQGAHLNTHMRFHTGERPFVCTYPGCTMAFTQGAHLNTHMRTHTKEKPFKCSFQGCNESFAQSGDKIAHERVHGDEKPFSCNIDGCTFVSRTSSGISKHRRSVHDGITERPCLGPSDAHECPTKRNGMLKYDKHCVKCFVSKYPNDPRSDEAKKWLHTRELTVRSFLQETFPQYRWVFDRTCAVGKLVRPDARTVLSKSRILIVEVDEESHNTYVCGDERERERIFKEHAPKDAVTHLIRFNPDAYDDPVTGKRVPTCFRYSKVEAVVTVHPDRQADWDRRLATLRSTIQEIIDHQREDIAVPECIILDEADDDRHKYVIPIELFYDNVREKWPDGNKQRLAALKRNAQRS